MSATIAVVQTETRSEQAPIYRRFVYRPLETSAFTRVIKLWPAIDKTADLECLLETISRDDIDYEPVSYTWGRQEGGKVLYHGNREKIAITRTVDVMLRHLRLTDRSRRLWIDAICINQTDNAEKAQQVERMSKIYKDRHVVIWLGEDFWYGEDVLQFLGTLKNDLTSRITPQDFNEPFAADGKFSNLVANTESWLEWHIRLAKIGGQSSTGTKPSRAAKFAIVALYERPYFFRLWVLQEMALASTGTIMCGTTVLPLDEFVLVSFVLAYQYSARLGVQDATSEAIRSMFFLRSTYQFQRPTRSPRLDRSNANRPMQHRQNSNDDSSHRDILWLLNSFWMSQCQDPRDRIFALLGLSRDARRRARTGGPDRRDLMEITISYDAEYGDVYLRFAQNYVQKFGDKPSVFMLLQSACTFSGQHNVSGWPSWVPDWSSTRKYAAYKAKQAERVPYLKAATDCSTPFICLADPVGNSLRLRGTIMDTVKATLRFDWTPGQSNPAMQYAFDCVELALKVANNLVNDDVRRRMRIAANVTSLLTGEGLDLNFDHCESVPWLFDESTKEQHNSKTGTYEVLFELIASELLLSDKPVTVVSARVQDEKGNRAQVHRRVLEVCKGRTFAVTSSGHYALCAEQAQPGDSLVAFRGAPTPFVVRPHHWNENAIMGPSILPHFELVSDAWIVGFAEPSSYGVEEEILLK